MVSENESVAKCLDKLAFAKIDGIDAIPAYENIEEIKADSFVVKERYGAGAISIGLDLSKGQALQHRENLEKPIFQPFIKGDELSIDAYVTNQGKVKGLVIRRRVLVVNGESQVTTTVEDEKLETTFTRIIESLSLQGHIILQALINEQNNVKVIECNPRFGGASTLSIRAGLDSFYWAYLESLGYSLEDYPFIRSTRNHTNKTSRRLLRMILVFDLDDTLYEEITYVKSSFKTVADYFPIRYN